MSEISFSYPLLGKKLAQFGGIKQPFILLISSGGVEFGQDIADILFCFCSMVSGGLNGRSKGPVCVLVGAGVRGGGGWEVDSKAGNQSLLSTQSPSWL